MQTFLYAFSFALGLAPDRDAGHAPRGQLPVRRAAGVRPREPLRELRAAQFQAEYRGRPFGAGGGGLQGHYQTFLRQVNRMSIHDIEQDDTVDKGSQINY